jgi:hypothetical protein
MKGDIIIDIVDNCNTLMVSFGSVDSGFGMPRHNFVRVTKNIKVNKVFLIDQHKTWFNEGINNEINSSEKLSYYLNTLIKTYGKYYTLFYGYSMGGYAALWYGAVLNVDKVLAFSPQTFISKKLRHKYGDLRWKKILQNFTNGKDIYSDVLNNDKTLFEIHVGQYPQDLIHVSFFEGRENVNIIKHPHKDHETAPVLRRQGKLEKILLDSIKTE